MSAANIARFNKEAAAWDSNPDVDRASDAAFKAILQSFPRLEQYRDKHNDQDGLAAVELGCGTGLLSFRVAPCVRSLVAVDTAEGMIDAVHAKLQARQPDNNAAIDVRPLCLEVTPHTQHALLPPAAFDLVLSHLVLHHIANLDAFVAAAVRLLRPGGWLCFTDYQDPGPDARRFHPAASMAGVEWPRGIDARDAAARLERAGLENVVVSATWALDKAVERTPGEWGGLEPGSELVKPAEAECARQSFPFLLCKGRRSARPQA